MVSHIPLTLYFADETGTFLVPVTREAMVVSKQVASAAMRELIEGPRGDLRGVVPQSLQVLGMQLDGNVLTVNLSQHPGDEQSIRAIALTLTEFHNVTHVQIEVQGTPIGLNGTNTPIPRPVLNIDNPNGLPTDYQSGTRFLPLYFLHQGRYVRITRLIPRTNQEARQTMEELLAGPGQYHDSLTSPIPIGTELRDIAKGETGEIVVDLTRHFVNASNRRRAIEVIVLSLTELRNPATGQRLFNRVEIRVEGHPLAEFWGEEYLNPHERPLLNPET
jgi:germination protein M